VAIDIRVVTAPHEVHAIQRQRYEIYVEQLGYRQAHACAVTRTVAEPTDASAVLFGAFDRDRLVASVRVTYGEPGRRSRSDASGEHLLAEYTDLYGLRRFGRWYPAGISVVTKLMIDPEHRAGTLMARLGLALYVHTRDTRPTTMFCVIDCVPRLRSYFERLGYRPVGPSLDHPAAGLVVPMAFPVYDRKHFASVRSPLARVCPRHDEATAAWFRETFVPVAVCPRQAVA
jgi:hypothetical protein